MNVNRTFEISTLCIQDYRNALFFLSSRPDVASERRLSHNSTRKLTLLVERNDRLDLHVLCHYFPFMRQERERCAHFVTLLATFVPTVVTSGSAKRTKKVNITYVRANTRGRAHRSTK